MDKEAINIDRFINGGMDAGERSSFEAQMLTDPFLAEAVDGFRQDPGALYDLPIINGLKINWWWTIVGFVAVTTVFLAIPNKISEIAEFETPKTEAVNVDFENTPQQFETQSTSLLRDDFNTAFENGEEILLVEEKFRPELIATDFVDLKSAKPILKPGIPTLKFVEKIIYILDLKVVKSQFQERLQPETVLSELTDFTPANFSTTIAYKHAKKYEDIFPEPKTETYMDKLESGLKYYKSEDYAKALSVFSILLDENYQDPNAQFYSALSHYHLGDYKTAEAGFARVEKLATLSFAPESKWYRALSLTKLGRKEKARVILLEIADGGGHYAERAKALLEKE